MPAARHMAVTRGAMAVMTPMLLHTELMVQETIRVARIMLRRHSASGQLLSKNSVPKLGAAPVFRRRPQFVENSVQNKIRLSQGGGARGGSRPPRMGSNAPEVLLCKASGKQSADFCAAQRHKSPRFARRKPCTTRLPGHLIPFEAGGCPLELPRPDLGDSCSTMFLDRQRRGH